MIVLNSSEVWSRVTPPTLSSTIGRLGEQRPGCESGFIELTLGGTEIPPDNSRESFARNRTRHYLKGW